MTQNAKKIIIIILCIPLANREENYTVNYTTGILVWTQGFKFQLSNSYAF